MKSFIQYLLEFDPNKGAKGRRQRDAMFKAYSQVRTGGQTQTYE